MTEKLPKGKLPLPSPRSPEELDERILDFARQQAPEPAPKRFPVGWAGGFAAACVATVAVIISVPEPALDQAPASPAAVMEAREYSGEEPTAARKSAGARADMPAPQVSAEPEVRIRAEKRQYRMEMDASAEMEEALLESPAAEDAAIGLSAAKQVTLPEDLLSELEQLRTMVEKGELEAAEKRWDDYRAYHPEIGLAEELDKALQQYLLPD